MKKLINQILLFLLCALTVPCMAYSKKLEKSRDVEITYIANEGFLIEVDDKKILIDALFGERKLGYCAVPGQETINLMIGSEGTFSNIDLLLASHSHIDHFYAPFVSQQLGNNSKCKFISCSQAIEKLKEQENYEKIKRQVVDITPDSLFCVDTIINDIDVRIYRLTHGPFFEEDPNTCKKVNRHRKVQNLGFLIDIDGVRIFHSGDSSPTNISDYEHFRFDREEIDIAFLSRGFLLKKESPGIEILRKFIKPKHVVLMHINPVYNEYFLKVANEVKGEFPSVKIFEGKMEMIKYTID